MKTKGTLLLSLLVVGSFALSGCFDDLRAPIDITPQAEFSQVNGGYSMSVAEGAGTVTLQADLAGPQRSTDTQLSFTTGSGTTATAGTHYTLPNGNSFVIPANSSFGDVVINVPSSNLAAGDEVDLVLVLNDSADGVVKAAENLKTFTVTIVGQ